MAIFSSAVDSKGYQFHIEVLQVSQDTATNTSIVSWKTYLTNITSTVSNRGMTTNAVVNGVTVLSDSNYRLYMTSTYSTLVIGSGTQTITHNSDGTKIVSVSALMVGNTTFAYGPQGTHAPSGSLTLTTIPRASVLSFNISTVALLSSIRIYTNRASSGFVHNIYYGFGENVWTLIASSVADYADWTPPTSLADQIPNSPNGTVLILCETISGSTVIGYNQKSLPFTVPNIATFQPIASITSISETGSNLSEWVQGKSSMLVVSSGTGKNGSTVSQYKVTVLGSNFYGSSINTGIINTSGAVAVLLTITDSRGFSGTATISKTFLEYYTPKINSFSGARSPTDQSTDLKAIFNFEIASVNSKNEKGYTISYRIIGGSWIGLVSGSIYSLSSNQSWAAILNGDNSYEVKLHIYDYYTSIEKIVTIGTSFELINFNTSGKGIALGKVSESDTFEVALATNFTDELKFHDEHVDRLHYHPKQNDITFGTLNAIGWYRVAEFSTGGSANQSFVNTMIMELLITRNYAYANNEAQRVTMFGIYSRLVIQNSKAINTQLIQGIRMQKSGTDRMYLDIFYNSALLNSVMLSVNFILCVGISFLRYLPFDNVTSEYTLHGSQTNLM